ncbi:MAG TPA: DNA-3-methyladenine glycosylase I [Actinomycetaceae bacterium]|nr:DNA-3-methyladenine glycosylase I [Actinomycetaceae bacterium]
MARGTEDDVFKLIEGDDGKLRPAWAAGDEMLRDYFDNEWGRKIHDEKGVFERLSLEVFQSGLSWATILRKRPAFREAFDDFDPEVVATYGPLDVERLLDDERIIRNRRKIEATIQNAQATLALREADDVDGGLAGLFWAHVPSEPILEPGRVDVPAQIPESAALAKDLRTRGFTMVGPVNICASMCAIGVIDVRGESGIF